MLSFFIGLRYTLSRKQSHLVAFISRISIASMVLAVALLITVMSVMNGFDTALKERILALVPHANIQGFTGSENWRELLSKVKQHKDVEHAEPFGVSQAMLMRGSKVKPSLLFGIDADYLSVSRGLSQFVSNQDLQGLIDKPRIILGAALAKQLTVNVGEQLRVLVPSADRGLPQAKYFNVSAIIKTGTELDQKIALIHRHFLAQLKHRPIDSVDGISVYVHDLFQSRRVAHELAKETGLYYVRDWSQTHGNLYQAIQMSRTLVLLLVFIIIAVAAFNVISTLVLAVNDKKADIAILRTLGCSTRQIAGVFVAQGTLIGFVGVLLGTVLGLLLSYFIGDMVKGIESLVAYQFLQTEIYPIDYLPSDIRLSDVFSIAAVAQLLSILATLIPAIRAVRVKPAEVLRYL